jgi:hypothetical protein
MVMTIARTMRGSRRGPVKEHFDDLAPCDFSRRRSDPAKPRVREVRKVQADAGTRYRERRLNGCRCTSSPQPPSSGDTRTPGFPRPGVLSCSERLDYPLRPAGGGRISNCTTTRPHARRRTGGHFHIHHQGAWQPTRFSVMEGRQGSLHLRSCRSHRAFARLVNGASDDGQSPAPNLSLPAIWGNAG